MSKELKGKIVMTKPQGGDGPPRMCIRLQDDLSNTEFAEINILFDDFVKALTAHESNMTFTVRGLENIGKQRETQRLEFPFDRTGVDHKDQSAAAYEQGLKHLPEGWQLSKYFGAQDSFNHQKGTASTRMFRYVAPVDSGDGDDRP